jgi:hypothetical protein
VEDWAGLAALLTDMSWLPGAGHVLVVSRSSLLLAAAPAGRAARAGRGGAGGRPGRAEEGEPVPFHLVLQDDTLGLAALRARLDAAGARYAELAGWDAEEPSAGIAVSARSELSGGPVDEVDLAAGTAVSTVDGVRELRRAWEEFRGGPAGRSGCTCRCSAAGRPGRGGGGAVRPPWRRPGRAAWSCRCRPIRRSPTPARPPSPRSPPRSGPTRPGPEPEEVARPSRLAAGRPGSTGRSGAAAEPA